MELSFLRSCGIRICLCHVRRRAGNKREVYGILGIGKLLRGMHGDIVYSGDMT